MINPMDLTGKHILITGASNGIGKETAILASCLGAKVSLVARSEEKLVDTLSKMENAGHKYYSFDLTQLEQIEDLIKKIVSEQGCIDGFVHCAGIAPMRPLAQTRPGYLQEVMNINFYSFAELMRIISKKKNSNDGASFIGVSSIAAIRGAKAQDAYSASKAAIIGMISPIAKELASRKMRMNAVAFGMIDTGMYQYFLDHGGDDSTLSNQYFGVGKPEDAANVIAFLLSGASAFITGTTIVADGGSLS